MRAVRLPQVFLDTVDGLSRKLGAKPEQVDGAATWKDSDGPPRELAVTMIDTNMIGDERWERLQQIAPPEEDGKLWVEQGRAYFQYFTETPFQGVPLHQKHVHTFIVHDGTRIEVHVSVTRFTEKDQPWLDKLIRPVGR